MSACNSGAPSVQLNTGQPAPTFQTFALDGTPVHFPAAFVGKPRVAQHKLVYAAFGGRMGGELHALQVTTVVPT